MTGLVAGLRARTVPRAAWLLVAWVAIGVGASTDYSTYSPGGLLLLAVGSGLIVGLLLGERGVRGAAGPPDAGAGCVVAFTFAAAVALFFSRPRYGSGPLLPVSYVFLASGVVLLLLWALLRRYAALPYLAVLAVAASAIAMIRADPVPTIDVWHMLQAATSGLSHGRDLYTVAWTDPFPVTAQHGYAYLPGSAVLLWPFRVVLGDVRYGLVAATALTAVVLLGVSDRPRTRLAASLTVLYPQVVYGLDRAWVDPLVVALACAAAYAAVRGRAVWATVLLAACLTTKQTAWAFVPMAWIWPAIGWRRTLAAVAGAAVFMAPWIVVHPQAFVHTAFGYNMALPPRLDSLSLGALAIRHGWAIPLAVTAAVTLVVTFAALRRSPRSAYGFFLGSAAIIVVFNLWNKQTFYNEWLLGAGLVLAAVVFADFSPLAEEPERGAAEAAGAAAPAEAAAGRTGSSFEPIDLSTSGSQGSRLLVAPAVRSMDGHSGGSTWCKSGAKESSIEPDRNPAGDHRELAQGPLC